MKLSFIECQRKIYLLVLFFINLGHQFITRLIYLRFQQVKTTTIKKGLKIIQMKNFRLLFNNSIFHQRKNKKILGLNESLAGKESDRENEERTSQESETIQFDNRKIGRQN